MCSFLKFRLLHRIAGLQNLYSFLWCSYLISDVFKTIANVLSQVFNFTITQLTEMLKNNLWPNYPMKWNQERNGKESPNCVTSIRNQQSRAEMYHGWDLSFCNWSRTHYRQPKWHNNMISRWSPSNNGVCIKKIWNYSIFRFIHLKKI